MVRDLIDAGPPPQATEKVYYAYSSNLGKNWYDLYNLGEGIYPSMAMNSDASAIGVAWMNASFTKVLYNYCDEGVWNGAVTLIDQEYGVTYSPVSIQYAVGAIHLATIRTTEVDVDEWTQDVIYASFPYDDPYSYVEDTIDHWRIIGEVDTMPQHVSIAVDYDGIQYLAYERPPDDTVFTDSLPNFDIYYAWQSLMMVWVINNISNTSANSIRPSIEDYGGHTYLVWQENINGYDIFLYKRNYAGFPPSEQTDTISQTSANALNPVTKMGGVILWSDNDPEEIYGRIWDGQEEKWLSLENWSNTSESSRYPVVDAWQNEGGTDIICGWTESADTCGFGLKYVSYFPSRGKSYVAFPSYYLDLGQVASTPFTKQRDTIQHYNSQCFDCGINQLKYHLPYIEPSSICKLYLELYRPDTTKDGRDKGDKWKIHLKIDNSFNMMIELQAGELKPLTLMLPSSVNQNGSAEIEFRKVNGDCILLRRLLLYEFEPQNIGIANTFTGGPQSTEEIRLRKVCFESVYPNPAKKVFAIRVNTPDALNLSVKIYDVTGRLIENIYRGKSKAGMNEFYVKQEELSTGVYFISVETNNYKKTQKVILVQ